ncbi:hypothetical protein [Desulfobacula sp.]|uniref:HVO_A0114 family putative DNA-binding protein n=1 Tax=Desulfobacula sp. TaxID=2593537 RepID=UPI001EB6907F|nr:hypothetical protein [Desulfobacula sp.]
MKKLIVSLKTSNQVINDFKKAFKKAKKGQMKDHFEISFDNRTDFNKFIRNLDILTFIIHHNPRSVYELAKLMEKDVSNLNKTILYYADLGVVKIKKEKGGRETNKPIVEFNKIEFDLAA